MKSIKPQVEVNNKYRKEKESAKNKFSQIEIAEFRKGRPREAWLPLCEGWAFPPAHAHIIHPRR
jgi:hypothetical protein